MGVCPLQLVLVLEWVWLVVSGNTWECSLYVGGWEGDLSMA